MAQHSVKVPDPPKRLRAADVIERDAKVIEHLAARTSYSPEPKIELDYKKAPGDSGPRTTWHIEIPAGFDDDETNRVYRKVWSCMRRSSASTRGTVLRSDDVASD